MKWVTETPHHCNKNKEKRCNCSVLEYVEGIILIICQWFHIILIFSGWNLLFKSCYPYVPLIFSFFLYASFSQSGALEVTSRHCDRWGWAEINYYWWEHYIAIMMPASLILRSGPMRVLHSPSVGVQKAVEKKKRLPNVMRRQADSPDSMIFRNFNFRLARISQRRIINPMEFRKPIIRNRHWKCSGSSMIGLWLKLSKSTPASPFVHNSSIWSSWSHSKFPQSSSNVLTVKPALRTWRI